MKTNKMGYIQEMQKLENVKQELRDEKLKLYNQWYDLKDTFGIDTLVGLQEFIESNSRVKELRNIIKEGV